MNFLVTHCKRRELYHLQRFTGFLTRVQHYVYVNRHDLTSSSLAPCYKHVSNTDLITEAIFNIKGKTYIPTGLEVIDHNDMKCSFYIGGTFLHPQLYFSTDFDGFNGRLAKPNDVLKAIKANLGCLHYEMRKLRAELKANVDFRAEKQKSSKALRRKRRLAFLHNEFALTETGKQKIEKRGTTWAKLVERR